MSLLTPLRRFGLATVAGVLAITGTTLPLPGPAHAAAAPTWPQVGSGPGDTKFNPYETQLTADTVAKLTLRWQRPLDSQSTDCDYAQVVPVVAGGRTFTADRFGVRADRADTGAALWTFRHPDNWFQAMRLAVVGSILIAVIDECFVDTGTTIVGLHVATGRRLWSNRMTADPRTVVVDRGVVLVAGSDDTHPAEVAAFRVKDGKRRWGLPNAHLSRGVSAGGRVLLSTDAAPGSMAVAIDTGRRLWRNPASWAALSANPAGDLLLVTEGENTLKAVKAASGKVVWSTTAAAWWTATDRSRVFTAEEKTLTALDAARGTMLWRRTMAGDVGRAVRAGELLYVPVTGEPMAVLDPATGATTAVQQTEVRHMVTQPVVVGGMVYSYDGSHLRAYGLPRRR